MVKDPDWNEALLDLRTADKRSRVAAKVGSWIDQCASKGFNGVEPDNYDSYSRSQKLLTADQAQAYIRLLSSRAHSRGLAIAQKNTSELAGNAKANGLDFAVAEECAEYDECGAYASAFNNRVEVVEYSDSGLSKACSKWGSTLSVVERDVDVTAPGSGSYVRRTC